MRPINFIILAISCIPLFAQKITEPAEGVEFRIVPKIKIPENQIRLEIVSRSGKMDVTVLKGLMTSLLDSLNIKVVDLEIAPKVILDIEDYKFQGKDPVDWFFVISGCIGGCCLSSLAIFVPYAAAAILLGPVIYLLDEDTHTGNISIKAMLTINDQKSLIKFSQTKEDLKEKEGAIFFVNRLIREITQ